MQQPVLKPWERLFPKQLKLFNMGVTSEAQVDNPDCPVIILCDGPRKSTKTIGVGHRFIRHLVETPGAHAALVARTTRSATDQGVWVDLIDILLPMWIESGETEFTTSDRNGNPGPVVDSKTRTIYFRIANAFGGESEVRLLSLDHDHEVKAKLKSSRWSCIWFSELSNFGDPEILRTSIHQLRMWHLKPYEHLWLSDTNPSDEGEDSWIYKIFYKMAASKEITDLEFVKAIRTLHFTIDDNLAMTDGEKRFQRSMYFDDPGELAREYDGRWVRGHGAKGKHFADVFTHDIHVIGGREGEGDQIDVAKETEDLFTGWDIGSGVNHAGGIVERRWILPPGQLTSISYWYVLDEILHIAEQIQTGDLGIQMLDKMNALEKLYGRQFSWIHYADDSALTMFRASSGTFDYLEILAATGGKIELTGVPKPAGSVHKRVQLIKRLLRQERLFVSARCKSVIGMFENLKKGSKESDYVEWNEYKHVFDWLSYIIFMEMRGELENEISKPTATTPSKIVTMRL